MKHPDQYASLFCLILGGGTTASSFYYGVGSLSDPGPAFITFLAGTSLMILSTTLFITSGTNREGGGGLRLLWQGRRVKKILYVMGLLAVYTFIINLLGFLICTFALLALLLRVQVTYSKKKIFLLSAVTTIAAFIIFDKWLGVQLPRGLLGYRFF
jgi:putative tricarboxylic transport membrane protein